MPPKIKPKTTTRDNRKKFDEILGNIQKIKSSYVKVGFPENDPKTNQKHHEAEAGQEKAGGTSSFGYHSENVGAHSLWSPEISAKATVLEIAVYHEFGAPKRDLPERSFMRASYDENVKKYGKLQYELFKKLVDGTISLDQALDIAGLMIQTDIKKFLTDGKVKPESRRAMNDGGKTLIDTAQMLNSITYKKVKGKQNAKDFGILSRGKGKSSKINLKAKK